MFLRVSKQRLRNGAVLEHFQLAESVWDRQRKRSQTHIRYSFGRVDDPAVVERLRTLAHSILRRCSTEEIVAENPDWRLVDAWPYGRVFALEALWRRLGLPEVLGRLSAPLPVPFPLERALFAMVANRALAPSSKLYRYEQCLREDVRIEGTAKLELQHLYRALDFLEAHQEAIEEALYFRLTDLFHLDVDLIFYDTTSLHFEVDEADPGGGEPDTVSGSRNASHKKWGALRQRGYAKNGQPQIVVGLAVSRDRLPVRHWVFPGNTVDVTTVKKVKEDLRGWKLSRCVFVGDAGMRERREPADARARRRQVHPVHAPSARQ
jgi:hypothetical protein